jgi:hypothetical protein
MKVISESSKLQIAEEENIHKGILCSLLVPKLDKSKLQ